MMTNEEFVELACPHSWFLVADDLHAQALELRRSFGQGHLINHDCRSGTKASWDNTNRSTFLLASFDLENAIKAFLVYENPGWISNGKLSKFLMSHKLTDLVENSTNIPYKTKGRGTLKAFEEGNESWARYPCALSKENSAQPSTLDEGLWEKYEWLMAAYGRRLIKLLSVYWKGPHALALFYVLLGLFLDGISITVMSFPITFPIVIQVGYDPLWFGVFLVIMVELGQITPPVGFNLFVLQGLAGESIGRVAVAAAPFFVLLCLAALLIAIWPGIVLWLPMVLGGRQA